MAVKKILSKTVSTLSFEEYEQKINELFDWLHENGYEFVQLSIAVNVNRYIAVITYEDKV